MCNSVVYNLFLFLSHEINKTGREVQNWYQVKMTKHHTSNRMTSHVESHDIT